MKEMSLKKAALYNSISKYGTLIVQLGITMILARLIEPEEHGVISLITVILAFFNLFADLGMGITIIQHKDVDDMSCNQLFTFSVIIGFFLAGAMCAISFPMSIIYDNKEYLKLCPMASIVAFFCTINTVPNALLGRDKKFDVIAIRTIICNIVSGGIAVVLAYKDFGAYALIIQSISSAVVLFVWNFISQPLKLVKFRWGNIAHQLGTYSLFQVLYNILNYFTRNLDNLVIGVKFGTASLAHYNKAYSLNLQPNAIFTSVITGVLHPYVRDFKNEHKKMTEKLVYILKILSIAGIFVMPICFWGADEIIFIMFGVGWENAAVCFKMLSICIWAQMLGSVAGTIFLAVERTDCGFLCGVLNFILILIAIFTGVIMDNLYLLSLVIGIMYNIIFVIIYYILIVKVLKESYSAFIKQFVGDIAFAFGFMGITMFIPSVDLNVWISLIIKVIVLGTSYCCYMVISKQFSIIMNVLKKKI